jgi:hypothetical protein
MLRKRQRRTKNNILKHKRLCATNGNGWGLPGVPGIHSSSKLPRPVETLTQFIDRIKGKS